jgi:hypothetical protein
MKTSGLDVHKDNISCAIYDGQKYTVKTYYTTTPQIRAMGAYLKSEGVKKTPCISTDCGKRFLNSVLSCFRSLIIHC